MAVFSPEALALAAITLAAATVQGATGFGFGVLAVAPYLLILDSLAAVQLAIAVTLAISLALVPKLAAAAPRPLLWRLILGSALGLPLGLAAYAAASLAAVKLTVGVLITLFAGCLLLEWNGPAAGRGPATWPVEAGIGVVSGAMTTSLAMPGPAVVLYLAALRTARDASRAATLTLFLFSYGAALALQALVAGMARETWLLASLLAPVAMLGAVAGDRLAPLLGPRAFRRAILAILLATGLITAASALAR